jgi:predicted GIY-YIG superfamily endonuclease
MAPTRFVYILRSESRPEEPYIGRTRDVAKRLWWHNHGPDGYTKKHRPWALLVSIEFSDERTAIAFERYLKSGSGRAFAQRHFAPPPSPSCGIVPNSQRS